MNSEIFKGKWNELKGNVQEQWGKLTEDDLNQAEGNRDQIIGKIQQRYGIARDQAEHEFDQFLHKM